MGSRTTKDATRMGLNLIERAALGTIRGLLNGNIGRFTPQQLQEAINENRMLWGVTPEKTKNQIQYWKNRLKTHFEKFFNKINTELLVEWLKKDQPKLCAVIMSDSLNYTWFDAQIEKFLAEIKNM